MSRADQKSFGVRTLAGNYINFMAPDPRQIDFVDAAHNLNNIIRYQGGMPDGVKFTILDHQMLVARIVKQLGGSRRARALGAIHDIPEAYTQDIPSPLKAAIRVHSTILDVIEAQLEEAVIVAADIGVPSTEDRALVKQADSIAAQFEHQFFRVYQHQYRAPRKVKRYLSMLKSLGVAVREGSERITVDTTARLVIEGTMKAGERVYA